MAFFPPSDGRPALGAELSYGPGKFRRARIGIGSPSCGLQLRLDPGVDIGLTPPHGVPADLDGAGQ